MEEITYKGKIVKIPSVLDELSSAQYIRFLVLTIMMNSGNLTPMEFRRKWLSTLLGMKTDYTLYRQEVIKELDMQLDKLDSFFSYSTGESGQRIVTPILYVGRNLMPDFGKWHGVGDMLNGLSFGDFCDCLSLLQQCKLIAGADDDNREVETIFRELTLKLYKHEQPESNPSVPTLLAMHAVNFFSGVWNMILSEPIAIGDDEIDFRILFQRSADRKPDDKTGWLGISFEVAASGVFGTMATVSETPFWDVLLYLYKCKFEYLHQKHKT